MEEESQVVRFTIGQQSSMAPEKNLEPSIHSKEEVLEDGEEIDGGVRLMYLANESDIEGIKELLDSGIDVNYRDIDDRTALHVASCQGLKDVVELLLHHQAEIDPKDRWGSTVRTQILHYNDELMMMNLQLRYSGFGQFIDVSNALRWTSTCDGVNS